MAAGVGDTLHIWRVGTAARRLDGIRRLTGEIQHIAWHPTTPTQVISASSSGSLAVWDVAPDLRTLMLETEDDDDESFGELEDLQSQCEPLYRSKLESRIRHVSWLGDHGVLALVGQRDSLQMFDTRKWDEPTNPVWEEAASCPMSSVTVSSDGPSVALLHFGRGLPATIPIPQSVTEHLGIRPRYGHAMHIGDANCKSQPVSTVLRQSTQEHTRGTMRPVPISLLKAERGGFSKTAEQMRLLRRRSSTKLSLRPATADSARSETTAIPITSPMISSLELPKPAPEDEDSPMPFLSPTIPSRKTSPFAISSLDDTLTLLPPPSESFDSLPSTAAPDSDSDDETFDGTTMLGSGNLMLPGGVNVPLPKSCGALFAPNGQLVTYFPPKPRSTAKADDMELERTSRSVKVAKLFPTFGNFSNGFGCLDDSDSESTASVDGMAFDGLSTFELPSSAPESHPLHNSFWPTKTNATLVGTQRSVNISVREIQELSDLRQDVALQYSLACQDAADGAALAKSNARVASDAGLYQTAQLWCLVEHSLSSKGSAAGTDVASHIQSIDFGVDHHTSGESRSVSGGDTVLTAEPSELLLTAQMLGHSWLIAQVLAMAEEAADIQTLGSISTLLLSYESRTRRKHQPPLASQASSPSADYFAAQRVQQPPPRPIPLLRNDSIESDVIHQSPAKQRPVSHASSRNPSQPTTPRLDSLSSTPPYPFPSLSRQGSRISNSGSASPEHHRSSFSAAAKYYAQSITEKFSTYGTSPPTKRLGTSPGNELSSSLPTGSWGKSVSFASTTDTARGSRQSVTQSSHDDDGYDSDRTIDDSSLPHTPKSASGEIVFRLKGAFECPSLLSDTEDALLPPLLLAKAQIWVRSYAEQLRAWDMIIEAAELESLAGPDEGAIARTKPEGIVPVPVQGQRKPACSICFAKIDGLQQACSHCLHTMHLSCLTDFLKECGAEDFECPTGCGCRCANLPYEETQWESVEVVDTRAAIRKRSLTDPRIWRARVEGSSW